MAITGLEYAAFTMLKSHGLVPERPRVIELGESNWYADVPTDQLLQDIARLTADESVRAQRIASVRDAMASTRTNRLYEVARIVFDVFLNNPSYAAIDPGTPGSEFKFDLNQPVPLAPQSDLTVNIGTSEHVFNVYQFYKTAHDLTRPAGLMLHSAPFTGWRDHGFYCFQPTFFFDLARANNYTIISFIIGGVNPLKYLQIKTREEVPALLESNMLPANTHINVVFRKPDNSEAFAIPTQGYYANVLSPEANRHWHESR